MKALLEDNYTTPGTVNYINPAHVAAAFYHSVDKSTGIKCYDVFSSTGFGLGIVDEQALAAMDNYLGDVT